MGIVGVHALLRRLIFNILVCNTDAHAKSYSLLIRGGHMSFAPIYHEMCAPVWPKITGYLAMSAPPSGMATNWPEPQGSYLEQTPIP